MVDFRDKCQRSWNLVGSSAVEAEPRPIFSSVVQNVQFSRKACWSGPWRYTLQSDDLYESLHDVVRDPLRTHDDVQSQSGLPSHVFTPRVNRSSAEINWGITKVRISYSPTSRLATG